MAKEILFENKNVNYIIGEDGEPLFELYSVGQALGYEKSNTVKGKTYFQCRKDRVDKVIENADIIPLVHNGLTYLTEEMIYEFMFEAKTEKCKAFRKWLAYEVLPSIRQNGGYIEDTATDEQVEKLNKKRLYAFNNIKKRLLECDYKNLEDVVKDMLEHHFSLGKKERYKDHRDMDKTEYKIHVTEYLCDKLEEVIPVKNMENPIIKMLL